MGIPRIFEIAESTHRIHDPFSVEKFLAVGRRIGLRPGDRVLDLACGSGEMLARWAVEFGITGTGVDLSDVFADASRARIGELGVADRVTIRTGDAAGYVADPPCEVACCIGATWIGGGAEGTVDLLRRSLVPDGLALVGEPFWNRPPSEDAAAAIGVTRDEWGSLPELVERLQATGCDLVGMVLADPDDWDSYTAPSWLNMRRWLDTNRDDPDAPMVRQELDRSVRAHVRYQRDLLGWGVFALAPRS